MKLAWLCYRDNVADPIIMFEEPDRNWYDKVITIVYAEIVE